MTSPPRPPSPPSGPPSGLNFSRWMEAQPFPPSPALTCRITWSTKSGMRSFSSTGPRTGPLCTPARLGSEERRRGGSAGDPSLASTRADGDLLRDGDDAHGPATALGAELDVTGGQREQRVVAAAADVVTRVEVGAALADDDLTGVDQLAAEPLDAQALCIRVAAVAEIGRASCRERQLLERVTVLCNTNK